MNQESIFNILHHTSYRMLDVIENCHLIVKNSKASGVSLVCSGIPDGTGIKFAICIKLRV